MFSYVTDKPRWRIDWLDGTAAFWSFVKELLNVHKMQQYALLHSVNTDLDIGGIEWMGIECGVLRLRIWRPENFFVIFVNCITVTDCAVEWHLLQVYSLSQLLFHWTPTVCLSTLMPSHCVTPTQNRMVLVSRRLPVLSAVQSYNYKVQILQVFCIVSNTRVRCG